VESQWETELSSYTFRETKQYTRTPGKGRERAQVTNKRDSSMEPVLSLIDVSYKLMGRCPSISTNSKKYEIFLFFPLVCIEKCEV
jgi:hypothetical protein